MIVRGAEFINGTMVGEPFDVEVRPRLTEAGIHIKFDRYGIPLAEFLINTYSWDEITEETWYKAVRFSHDSLGNNVLTLNPSPYGDGEFVILKGGDVSIYLMTKSLEDLVATIGGVTSCVSNSDFVLKVSCNRMMIKGTSFTTDGGYYRSESMEVFQSSVSETAMFKLIATKDIQSFLAEVEFYRPTEPPFSIFLEKKSLDGFAYFKSVDGSICFTFETDPELKLSFRLMRTIASAGSSEQNMITHQLTSVERSLLSKIKTERRNQAFLAFAIKTLEDFQKNS